MILIHFETAAGRSYVLQYADAVCFRVAGLRGHVDCTVWKALFTVPVLPFPNHYVIADRRVGGHRIYRLQVTP